MQIEILKIMLKVLLMISIQLILVKTNNIQRIDHANKFWQLTDVHWDQNYSMIGDQLQMCHQESNSSTSQKIGHYGNYLCDSPWPLVNLTLHNMKAIEPKPKFILWTGDNAPHTGDVNTFPVIFETIYNVTSELMALFGKDCPIIPVLGNHDSFPKDNFPATSKAFYGKYLYEGGWDRVIPANGHADFKRGGYFKYKVSSTLSILVLNTNLYYSGNKIGTGDKDPANQFQWMRKHFQEAVKTDAKIIIAAHAPPGYFERSPFFGFFNETYNEFYVDLLNEFGSVVLAQIYGHLHTDTFRIFAKSRYEQTSVAFMAPSVTPWHATDMDGATGINPSLRLFSYDSDNIFDFTQYHMNLSEANSFSDSCSSTSSENCRSPKFEEYYKATEFFGIDSLNVEGAMNFYGKLSSNDSLFQEYFAINSGGHNPLYCNVTCKRNYLCSVVHLKTSSLRNCMDGFLDHFVHQYHPKLTTRIPPHLKTLNSTQYATKHPHLYSHSFMAITVCVTAIASILVLIVTAIALAFTYKRRSILAAGANLSEWTSRKHGGYRPLNVEVE